ncbi:MAG: ATP-grasp domain-containing protein [Bryobacterales bacterium]|nr:ATP-grasp domain-containing protein [Bryobacterales bacterium]
MSVPRVLLATTVVPDDRKTLACARALAEAGIWVAVGGDALLGQAYWSRSVRLRLQYPHPSVDGEGFLAALNQHVERHEIDVVLPMNDSVTLAVSRMKDRLPRGVHTALPCPDAVEIAADKAKTLALAAQLGIEVPKTFAPQSGEELYAIAGRIGYPCVLKPNCGSGAIGLSFPANSRELAESWRRGCRSKHVSGSAYGRGASAQMLIQECVPGETHDVCVIACHGEPRASLTQHRRWMYPHRGGVGVSVESTDEPQLRERAHRILAALRWHGPACVEFRVDPKVGRIWLLEINGRLGGASAAGIHAGVNYPLLLTRLALDGDIEPVTGYRLEQRFRWPLPFALLALKHRAPWDVVREFFLPARGVTSDLRWSDPLPHLAEIAFAVRRLSGIGGRGWVVGREKT